MIIDEFIQRSGDSILREYKYSDGILFLEVETDDSEILSIKIKSQYVFFNISNQIDLAYRTFFIQKLKISKILAVSNGIYVPSVDFGNFMSEKRQNLNLAYGLKSSEYEYVISLNGSSILLSVVIRSLNDIVIELIEPDN